KTDEEKANGAASISYTNQVVGADERAYLRALPLHIRVEFQLNQDKLQLLLVHGSPRRINEYLFEDREEKSMLRILRDADADILCFGHTHKPYHRVFLANRESSALHETHSPGGDAAGGARQVRAAGDAQLPYYRHAINIGSVGKPKDGDPRGCYVLLTIDEGSNANNKESVLVEFVRFEYDVEKAARAVEESPLPGAYAEALRKAK
ncbi:MAG TPA: metallophosphoesterase family protein, partial [Puia sp.]|nr:metallophosphoesterase family protein [Puia sp.]